MTPGVGTVSPGIPDGITFDPLSDAPAAAWIEPGVSFAIVTVGSSSCPPVATEVKAESEDLVSVTFARSPHNTCTADMAPTTHQFDLPESVTADAPSVEIRFEGSTDPHTVVLD